MKQGIYWLASYPKSGNTWLRAIITNYMLDLDQPVDINSFQTNSIASSRQIFDENLCISSSDLSNDEIQKYQPEAYKELVKNSKKNLYIKTHDAYTLNSDNKPIFPKEVTKGVLYIVRNPLDVVVSYSAHNSVFIDKTINNLNNEKFIVANSIEKPSSQLPQKMLSWSSHVNSWLNSDLPLCLIKYEDMINKPHETFSKALEFLGFDIDEKRLKKAIKFSSFKELKKQEESKSFNEKPLKAKSFFRSGKINSYKGILNEDMIDKILKHHKKMMLKLKYLDSSLIYK